jgi:hypothetical protein
MFTSLAQHQVILFSSADTYLYFARQKADVEKAIAENPDILTVSLSTPVLCTK